MNSRKKAQKTQKNRREISRKDPPASLREALRAGAKVKRRTGKFTEDRQSYYISSAGRSPRTGEKIFHLSPFAFDRPLSAQICVHLRFGRDVTYPSASKNSDALVSADSRLGELDVSQLPSIPGGQ
jgi:hypothetical protein